MAYTLEDFSRDHPRNMPNRATPEERLRGLPPEAIVDDLHQAALRRLAARIEQQQAQP